jgi:hypothetical protein
MDETIIVAALPSLMQRNILLRFIRKMGAANLRRPQDAEAEPLAAKGVRMTC